MPTPHQVQFRSWRDRYAHVAEDINWLYRNQLVWNDMLDHLSTDEHSPSTGFFVRWFGDVFWRSQAVGIRRHAEVSEEANSFAKLLRDITKHPSALCRSNYVDFMLTDPPSETRPDDRQLNATYDFYCATPGDDLIDLEAVSTHRQSIDSTCRTIAAIADRRVAHHDRRPVDSATLGDVRVAVETLEETCRHYYPLFELKVFAGWELGLMLNWRDPFRPEYFE